MATDYETLASMDESLHAVASRRGVDWLIDRALRAIETEHQQAIARWRTHADELHRAIKAGDLDHARWLVDEWEKD